MLIAGIIGTVAVLAAVIAIIIYKESKEFCISFYEYHSTCLSREHYRIVFLSDLHDKVFGEHNEPLLEAIDDLRPDAVMFAGDMVTSSMELHYDYAPTIQFIGKLAEKYPVYYGMGNHEEKFRRQPDIFPGQYEDLSEKLAACGVHIMENETVRIPEAGITVYGLNLEHEYYRKLRTKHLPPRYLQNIFGDVNKENYTILLAHNPEHFPEYAAWEPDLIVSGHIHGGVIRLPLLGGVVSPQLKLFPKYDAGEFRSGSTTMLLSRGIGSHTIPIRIWNRAEVLCVDLKKQRGIPKGDNHGFNI